MKQHESFEDLVLNMFWGKGVGRSDQRWAISEEHAKFQLLIQKLCRPKEIMLVLHDRVNSHPWFVVVIETIVELYLWHYFNTAVNSEFLI